MYANRDVSIYGMGLSMATVEAGFDESLENVSVSVGQEEGIKPEHFCFKERTL